MDLEEYQASLKTLREKHNLEESKLAREYAFSNSEVEPGDTVEDHMGHVLVETVKFTKSSNMQLVPQCIYHGICLTKQMKPRKNGVQVRGVAQSNLKNIIKRE